MNFVANQSEFYGYTRVPPGPAKPLMHAPGESVTVVFDPLSFVGATFIMNPEPRWWPKPFRRIAWIVRHRRWRQPRFVVISSEKTVITIE